jgi:hypothetical protein
VRQDVDRKLGSMFGDEFGACGAQEDLNNNDDTR